MPKVQHNIVMYFHEIKGKKVSKLLRKIDSLKISVQVQLAGT